MDTSDQEKPIQTRTPPKKLRNFGGQKDRLERRRIAVGKYVAKEMEEIEMCKTKCFMNKSSSIPIVLNMR
jgi:hypothetical protein